MSKIKFSEWWDKVGSKTKPCDYHGRLSHAERMAEMAWDAISAELNEHIEELEYEIKDLAARRDA